MTNSSGGGAYRKTSCSNIYGCLGYSRRSLFCEVIYLYKDVSREEYSPTYLITMCKANGTGARYYYGANSRGSTSYHLYYGYALRSRSGNFQRLIGVRCRCYRETCGMGRTRSQYRVKESRTSFLCATSSSRVSHYRVRG